jgi:hypothetical protein
MIIEPDLADRHDPLTSHELSEPPLRHLVIQTRVVRVDADRRVGALILLGHSDRPLKVLAVRVARPHIQERAHARLTRTRHYLVAVGVELLAVNVRVGIDEHCRQ